MTRHETFQTDAPSAELLRPIQEIIDVVTEVLCERLAERVGGMLPDFETRDKQTGYALEAIRTRLDTFAGQAELLDNVNRTHRMLGEQFYDQRIVQPMVRGLFPLVDLLEQAMGRENADADLLSALLTQLEQFLALYGIESYRHAAGDDFEPAVMKPLSPTATNDPALDGLIAKSLQCGFRTPERILRLETVSLHRFRIDAKTRNALRQGESQ